MTVGGGLLASAAALALWGAPAVANAGVVFAPQPAFSGAPAQDIAIADFDDDGDLDLATVQASELSVLLGGPGASFGPPTVYPAGGTSNSIATRDFNGDGDPDLVHTDFEADKISVRLGGPGGTFGARNRFVVGDGPAKVFARDLNADGDPDLVVVNDIDTENLHRSVSVLLGESGGGFGPRTTYFSAGISPRTTVLGDFNDDGDPDLVSGSQALTVLPGGPGGSFGAPQATGAAIDRGITSLAVSDFNGDGDPDLAAGTQSTAIGVVLGGPGVGFGPQTYFEATTGFDTRAEALLARDLNGDGATDLAFVKYTGFATSGFGFGVVLGQGNGAFGPPSAYSTNQSPGTIASADFDGEIGPDVLTADVFTDPMRVFRNTGLAATPLDVAFPQTVAGAESATKAVQLKNNRESEVAVAGVSLTGADAASFSTSDDTCAGTTLQPGGKCSIRVRFAPERLGGHTAALEFEDDVLGSPHAVTLSGTGLSPIRLSNPELEFFMTTNGQSPDRYVSVNNVGPSDVSIGAVTIAGADATRFSTVQDDCTGVDLAPGHVCLVSVSFYPLRLGLHSATLEIADDAPGSPQTVALEGHGVPQATVSPSSVAFAPRPDSTASVWRGVTLTNIGTVDLHVTGVAVTGAGAASFPTSRDRCTGATLPPAGECVVRVRFRPDGTGLKSATLEISDDALGSPRKIPLSGTGTPGPWLTASAPNLKFGQVQVGATSVAKSVTLTNTGSAPMEIGSVVIDGANPANFGDLSTTCGGTLAIDASCTAQLTFRPQALGEKRATLTIQHTAPLSPTHIVLRGTGA